MMFSTALITVAIVAVPHVSSPPPAPATASPQQDCQYSVMINDDSYKPVYKCYTQAEYDQKVAADQAAQNQQAQRDTQQLVDAWYWFLGNWWKLLLWTTGGLVLLFIASGIYDSIDRKRHPWKYDEFGFRRDLWM